MKIKTVQMLHADAGWRPWSFVKITTDEGLVGWSECTESNGSPHGMEGVVRDMAPLIVGREPEGVVVIMEHLRARTMQSRGSIVDKALGGIENALLDIIGKSRGIPVYKLFGERLYETLPLYWSHCGTSRVRAWNLVGESQIKSHDDVIAFGKDIRASGFKAIKTNIGILGAEPYVYMPGFGKSPGDGDGNADVALLKHIDTWVGSLREAAGPDIAIALDLNFNFNPEACIEIEKILEPYQLAWLEIDMYDPVGLKTVSDATTTPVVSCENILGERNYKPYLDIHAMDIASVDIIWNGFTQSLAIAETAKTAGMQIVPHNYNGHLSTFISAQWALVTPNMKMMEYDVDDVSWRNDLFTNIPDVSGGTLTISDAPGWGCDVREDVIAEHIWPKKN
jgi:L-alanine-DL-glutamate epimerase-like enolase superfamily enzyme